MSLRFYSESVIPLSCLLVYIMSSESRRSLGLRELIETVASEILDMAEEKQGREGEDYFEVERLEVEVQTQVTKSADGKINIQVVQAGAEVDTTRVHTVRITLVPSMEYETKGRELTKGLTAFEQQPKGRRPIPLIKKGEKG